MNATITNIILENNRFRAFILLSNGVEETNLFTPEVSAQEIKDWVMSRIDYHVMLKQKEQDLQEELINQEL